MNISSDDFNLINDCIAGRKNSWDIFVDRFSRLIYHSINNVTKSYSCNLNTEDIEDIYNGVFLSFIENDCRKLRQFEGRRGCTLSSWIRLITVRKTIDFLRNQKQYVSISVETDDTRTITETLHDNKHSILDQLEFSETEKRMKELISSLPASDRLFIKLYYEKELPPNEIASIMNVKLTTIYSKKNRIREKLEKIIEKDELQKEI